MKFSSKISKLVGLGAVQAGLATALVTAAFAGQSKVTICHIPPGNPANAHEITVSASAVAAHLKHGDVRGECAPACAENGSTCTADAGCCSGNCARGTCADPCLGDGGRCGESSECCSNLCSGEGICTSACTIGPELEDEFCNENLPCCPGSGVCIGGACFLYDDLTCEPQLGGACDNDAEKFCCFDYLCIDNACTEGP